VQQKTGVWIVKRRVPGDQRTADGLVLTNEVVHHRTLRAGVRPGRL